MKVKTLAVLLLLLVAFLAGDFALQSARAQGPATSSWAPFFSLVSLDDGTGNLVPTVRISGANLQVVNGLGATNGYPTDPYSIDPNLTVTNGAGNLIVGYGEPSNTFVDDRVGSHNVVFGVGNSFSSFGGVVGAAQNRILAPFTSVTGGFQNTTQAAFASISGGTRNIAYGQYSSVSGGLENWSVGEASSVSAGYFNVASGVASSISGGMLNQAQGNYSSVSGGRNHFSFGTYHWRAGSLFESY